MNTKYKKTILAAVLTLTIATTSGCNLTNPQSTIQNYAPSNGVQAEIQGVQLRNMLIISTQEGTPGQLLGSIINENYNDINITITHNSLNETTHSTNIAAQQALRLIPKIGEDISFPTIKNNPGSLEKVTFSINSHQITLDIPILDGALPEYREYLEQKIYSDDPNESSNSNNSNDSDKNKSSH